MERVELVGRQNQVETVTDVVHRALTGPTRLLLLGEAGAGKTTLLHAAIDLAHRNGQTVVSAVGRASEAEQPLGVLQLMLLPLLDAVDRLPSHQRDALLAACGTPAPDAPLDPPDPSTLRLGVLALLGHVARERPLLLVVDDVGLVDRDSRDVLTFVARRLTRERVGLLFAARGDVAPDVLDLVLPRLVLDPLDESAAARLLDSLPVPPTGRGRLDVLRNAQGNPLALVEFSRALERGAGARSGGGPAPVRLQEMLSRQLSTLPDDTRWLLLLAAAGEFEDLATITAAAGLAPDDLAGWVPAEAAGLVTVRAAGVDFRHPLVRAAVHDSAPAQLRARAHRRLAAVLERDPLRRSRHLAEASSGPDEAVAAALEESVELARRRGGVFAAARAWQRAAECTPDPTERARRYARAVAEADDFGDPGWSRELHAEVVRLTDDPAILTTSALGAAHGLSLAGRQDAAHALLTSALPRGELGPGVDLAVGSVLSAIVVQSGDPAHLADLERWTPSWRSADERDLPTGLLPAALRPAVREGMLARVEPERWASRLAGTPGSAVNTPLEGPADLVRSLSLGSVCWFADDSPGALRAFDVAHDVLRAHGRIGPLVMTLPAMVAAALDAGRWDRARQLIDETRTLATVHRLHYIACDVDALTLELDAMTGAAAGANPSAHPLAERRIDLAQNRMTHVRMLRAAGIAATARGEHDRAFAHLRGLFAVDGTPLHPFLAFRSLAVFTAAACAVGAVDQAAVVVERVRRALPDPTTRMRLQLHHAEALVADQPGGRAEDVERSFRLAVVDAAGEDWPLERAQARAAYGSWLRRRRRPADAAPLLEAAHATFVGLGAVPWAERVAAEARACGTAVSTTSVEGRWELLTPQEREVVQLAARGLRNKEIATRMFLSPRTVGSHLHRAYPKLGVTGRHQLHTLTPPA